MPEELEMHSEDWYVNQYNRNRHPDDWVKDYIEFTTLMNAMNNSHGE